MPQDISHKRLIQNEQLVRDQNLQAGLAIKKYFSEDKEIEEAPIAFVCECSNLDCGEHVHTSIADYQKLHARKDHFTVFPGHVTSTVERVVKQHSAFEVVEKFAVEAH